MLATGIVRPRFQASSENATGTESAHAPTKNLDDILEICRVLFAHFHCHIQPANNFLLSITPLSLNEVSDLNGASKRNGPNRPVMAASRIITVKNLADKAEFKSYGGGDNDQAQPQGHQQSDIQRFEYGKPAEYEKQIVSQTPFQLPKQWNLTSFFFLPYTMKRPSVSAWNGHRALYRFFLTLVKRLPSSDSA
jgi:hypothetical protein